MYGIAMLCLGHVVLMLCCEKNGKFERISVYEIESFYLMVLFVDW